MRHQTTVEILGAVDAIFDFIALAARVSPLRPVAMHVHLGLGLDDSIGRQEAVFEVGRQGRALILADRWPEKVGKG